MTTATTTLTQATHQPTTIQERSTLWGAAGSNDKITAQVPQATDINTYVYAPGDSCNVIAAQDGIHLLWLRHIHAKDVRLEPTCHGKVQVTYKQEPILRMVGVHFIRTDDGCFCLDHWLKQN